MAETNGPAHVFSYTSSPTALRLDERGGFAHIVIVEQTRLDSVEDREIERAVSVQVRDRHSRGSSR
jgi:hypothetical protein